MFLLRPQIFFRQTYAKIVAPHIAKILESDENAELSRYSQCRRYIEQLPAELSEEQKKMRANMLFNTACAGDALSPLKPCLSSMISSGQISNQYQLDQVLKWLGKEVKTNRNISEAEIRSKLSKNESEMNQFEEQLQILSRQSKTCDATTLCKKLREKYFTLDSKTIFQRVTECFRNKATPKKSVKLWEKLGTIKPRVLPSECNSKEVYEEHLKVTGGKLRFRFPPEPNGSLHLGHAKAIRLNFESARQTGGTCYLRFDDTNPEKESRESIEQIERDIKWLGYTPDKITFSSDYFQQIMHYGNELIKKGHAYVCDSDRAAIQAERREKQGSPYRKRSIEQSLKIFPNLDFNQTLRLKDNPAHPNPTLRDPILYRRKNEPHPRTGTKYKIYPMYDFTHGICDSIEHIDYSFCSLQFEVRRELYYIFLDHLGLFKPLVWEFSRLNVEGALLSKRKIVDMLARGQVEGWEDRRLLTLQGLKNRGYTPEVLGRFVDRANSSRSGNENRLKYEILQKQMRRQLVNSPKQMGVLEPQQALINSPHNLRLFLERTDMVNLKEGDRVILKGKGVLEVISQSPLTFKQVDIDDISAYRKRHPETKVLNFVEKEKSKRYKVVMYGPLITPEGTYNSDSQKVYQSALLPSGFRMSGNYIQLQRIGFFTKIEGKDELHLCVKL